jgi:hypothetical protein
MAPPHALQTTDISYLDHLAAAKDRSFGTSRFDLGQIMQQGQAHGMVQGNRIHHRRRQEGQCVPG